MANTFVAPWRKGSFRIGVNPRAVFDGENGYRTGYISACGTWGVNHRVNVWYLTHIPSGLRASETRLQANARECAGKLSALAIDWSGADIRFLSDTAREDMRRVARESMGMSA